MTQATSAQIQSLVSTYLGDSFDRDADTGVWSSPLVPKIDYPSDAFARDELGQILTEATDLSSTSAELDRQGRRWPASYYLSPHRTNLLRPFVWSSASVVLEVGAGCGTITRFLGEEFEFVLAVEGDPVRAAAAAARVRDLDNVVVVCASYDQLTFLADFDYVFCIGVLEYAPLYNQSANPFEAVTRGFNDHLKTDGALVVAIENQLGLKYFAGAAEDHSGIRFDGIEGYRRSAGRSARTLGRAELDELLETSGFGKRRFFFPFPDYKFVNSVVADVPSSAASRLSGLIGSEPAGDYLNGTAGLVFDTTATWEQALKNGLLGNLANSFLVVAEKQEQADHRVAAHWDAVTFNMTPRSKAYWTRTEFVGLDTGSGEVRRSRMAPELPTDPRLSMLSSYREPWHHEETLAAEVERTLHVRGVTTEHIAESLRPWARWLREQAADDLVPGTLFDAIPRNLTTFGGTPHLFDRELALTEPIALDLMVLRGIHYSLADPLRTPRLAAAFKFRGVGLVSLQIARDLGWTSMSLRDLRQLVQLEHTVQCALGAPGRGRFWRSARMLLIGTPADFAMQIALSTRRRLRGGKRLLRRCL